ncbi:rRNA maturation RNase YbeY [Pseudosulfitobacter sp. DSM 107133]|uniref:rRNA maturation RNase YbeY n=1 Tax=Pseudosulfitobacter sp. DSM 107133 TaxID=2883100 RepID=UPI000DF482CA|nr:rRNA maturation RNase YbeY [Pseudosulfitobacter sp. DSM 107133]
MEDPRWEQAGLSPLADRAAQATFSHLNISEAEIAILACDDARIAGLNADFRGKPTPTNVLSWPSDERGAERAGGIPLPPEPDPDGTLELGDIAIAYDTCAAEAAAAGKSLPDHATHLIVHGILHLLGYDHVRDADATLMERLEVEILGKMGLDDPYSPQLADPSA